MSIERNFIIGLITSTEFIQRMENSWKLELIQSPTARNMATWIMDYYQKYNRAPEKDIGPIFFQKSKKLSKDIAEDIEDILQDLSDYNEESPINVDYLTDQSIEYFKERHLISFGEQIKAAAERGDLLNAEKLALYYTPLTKKESNASDLSDPAIYDKLKDAFNTVFEPLIEFNGALGEFWNDQLVRGGFVALMGAEKRGKTFWLLEFAMRAAKQKRKVAFFQAGDMTEAQQLMRMSIYLTRKSNNPKFCGEMFEPVKDCIYNQTNKCTKKERACNFGIFKNRSEKDVRQSVTMEELKKAFMDYGSYEPCSDCAEFKFNRWGTPWIKKVNVESPLVFKEARIAWRDFFVKHERRFKLATYPSNTLSVRDAELKLDIWEKESGFQPDVIIFDYPDIMVDQTTKEFRHKQNQIWMSLRGLAQKHHALVAVVTQADADAYDSDLLKQGNFSEDKRKYAHPTAFWGLNQDHTGREKELGIMRINELIKREGDYNIKNQVTILQNLKRGIPNLTSYW
jgi:hypothetical protein